MRRLRIADAARRDLVAISAYTTEGWGRAKARQYLFTLPDGAAGVGQISFTVKTDANNNVFEYNQAGDAETNNTAAGTIDTTLATNK